MYYKASFEKMCLSVLCLALMVVSSALCHADDGRPVAKIGEEVITEQDLKDVEAAMPERYRGAYFSPEGRQKAIDSIVNVYVMAGAAQKEGLDKFPEVAKLLEYTRKNILARVYLEKMSKNIPPVTEADAKVFFEQNKTQFMNPESIHLHHVLVKTDKEAKEIMDRIKKGEKLSDIAGQVSLCPSKVKGGDLGWLPKGSLVKEIEDVAFKMKPSQLLGPVQSQYGYHVLFLEEKRPGQENSFDQVKNFVVEQLRFQRQQEQYDKLTDALKKAAHVEIMATPEMPTGAK